VQKIIKKLAYEASLSIIVFSIENVDAELKRLKTVGMKLRPELDKPEWEVMNMFEDGCGNILMLEKAKA
jgi:predicted enzyme related to lactoylglutathione lyase